MSWRMIRVVRRLGRRVRSFWPVRIQSGPAAGLRMDLRRASAWYAAGTNETPVQHALAKRLSSGGVFFDVGANVGFFSLIGSRLVGPGGRVISFEPAPTMAASLRRNVELNRLTNVTVVEAAVAAAPGEGELMVDEHPGGSFLSSSGGAAGPARRARVRIVSIDDLVERGEVPPPTLVKIDVEGAEAQVLVGMSRTAARHLPAIICEVDDEHQEAAAAKLRAVEVTLKAWGYEVRRLERSYPPGGWCVEHILAVPM